MAKAAVLQFRPRAVPRAVDTCALLKCLTDLDDRDEISGMVVVLTRKDGSRHTAVTGLMRADMDKAAAALGRALYELQAVCDE